VALSAFSFETAAVNAATVDALERVRQALGVRRTALFWLDDASSRLACVATAGAGGPIGWLGQTLAAGLGMAGRAVREGRPVWTADLLADPNVPIAPWLRDRLQDEGLRTVAAAPVRVDGAVSGALGFLDGPGRSYDEPALQQLGRLADEVAERVTRAVGEGP
jgi:GAF domain-containing protein